MGAGELLPIAIYCKCNAAAAAATAAVVGSMHVFTLAAQHYSALPA
jgi:hypothetical protein